MGCAFSMYRFLELGYWVLVLRAQARIALAHEARYEEKTHADMHR